MVAKKSQNAIMFQTAYGSKEKPKVETGKGLTEQAHSEQCNINVILEDYKRTGLLKHAAKHEGRYDDVSEADFQTAMQTVANVRSLFEGLPSDMRKRFGGDPGQFLNFVRDPQNFKEMAQMGILRGNDGLDISGAFTGAPVASPDLQSGVPQGQPAAGANEPAQGDKT